jgi:hypothetical protein
MLPGMSGVRTVLQALVASFVLAALAAPVGPRASPTGQARPTPAPGPVRTVEVVKPRGFDLSSALVGSGVTVAAVGLLAAGYVLTYGRSRP